MSGRGCQTKFRTKVIAISPEKPEYLDKMAEKTGARFTLLYYEGYRIAKGYFEADFLAGRFFTPLPSHKPAGRGSELRLW